MVAGRLVLVLVLVLGAWWCWWWWCLVEVEGVMTDVEVEVVVVLQVGTTPPSVITLCTSPQLLGLERLSVMLNI